MISDGPGEGVWYPSRHLVAAIRAYGRPGSGVRAALRRKLAVARHRVWSIVCACDVPINCQLGPGIDLPHPFGVVIHPKARIGKGCVIFQGVTIGVRSAAAGAPAPVIGDGVEIGAGATILGGITIGSGAKIGAGAVVLHEVPAFATAVGVPARVIGVASVPRAKEQARARVATALAGPGKCTCQTKKWCLVHGGY